MTWLSIFQSFTSTIRILLRREVLILKSSEYGIGIKKMALVDTNQDPACMAANACLKLMERNHLHPEDIGRMYVATESGLDEY